MLWPWNGGASSLRRARCSLPSSAKTDPGPKIRLRFGCTLIRSSVLARNTCRTNAGPATTTLRPKNGTLMANTGPKRFTAYRKNERRNPAIRTIWTGIGRRTAGGILPGVVGAFVSADTAVSVTGESLPAVSLVLRCTVGVCSTVPLGTKQAQGLPGGEMATALDNGAHVTDADPFRDRLLDGLAASIGYRDTTVADIVRHARTSKRTFYEQFASKEECLIEVLRRNNENLIANIRAATDPEADWQEQIGQAAGAYVDHIASRPAITLSWIREAPALGAKALPLNRLAMERLTDMLVDLSDSPGFRRAGLPPISRPLALILLGGLRELTALFVEDGRDLHGIVEPAIAAATAMFGRRS